MFWKLISQTPAVIYLGEYQLYCYLFKIRQLFRLQFSLVLYTGGQAIPGLKVFDPRRDFVHHVTDVYLSECMHLPANRQIILPHFINEDFEYSETFQKSLQELAGDKKLVLSVGLLDKQVKRMDWLIEALMPLKESVFPVLIGTSSEETPMLRQQLLEVFGPNGFLMHEVPHRMLGDYFKVASLFVSCSPKESFGLAMIEALWHGLPVVCFSYPESRFVLKDQAAFVPKNSLDELALTLKQMLTNQESAINGEKTRNFVAANYTWEALAESYRAVFQNLF